MIGEALLTAKIAIKNISQSAIEDWTLEFDYDGNLDRFWTAEITGHTGNHYVIHNAGYNANIQPGETLILGFSGNPGNVVSAPSGYQLTQISTGEESPEPEPGRVSVQLETYSLQLQNSPDGDYYFLTSKMDKLTGTLGGVSQVKAFNYEITDKNKAVLQQGTIPVSAAWSAEGIGLGIGYNLLKLRAQVQDGTEVTKEYIIVNFDENNLDNLGIDREKDSDKDGISDYYEEHYGLSATSKDTDGDGLSDRDELLVLKLNPLETDSDKNGTADGDEDYDKDGLTNLEELMLGTSLISEDSDGDGLTDGEEVHTHKTDPLKADTDGDGLSDAWELQIGSDPLVPETKFARTMKAEDVGGKAVPTVAVEGITAEQVDSLSVQPVQDGILNDTTIPGYIDQGYNFSIDGSFEKATISFEFDKSLLSQAGFVPRIYYYNEESQLFEELPDQQVAGNMISVQTVHFSKYILLNKTVYDQVWLYKFLYDEGQEHYAGMDIAFVIDSSGSMSDNDRSNVRISVTRQFVNLLTDSDRGAIVDF
ncbi:cellulose binding domain-containing protein [Paenibacillus rhizoplanae]